MFVVVVEVTTESVEETAIWIVDIVVETIEYVDGSVEDVDRDSKCSVVDAAALACSIGTGSYAGVVEVVIDEGVMEEDDTAIEDGSKRTDVLVDSDRINVEELETDADGGSCTDSGGNNKSGNGVHPSQNPGVPNALTIGSSPIVAVADSHASESAPF